MRTKKATAENAEHAEKTFALRSLRSRRLLLIVTAFLMTACGRTPPSGGTSAAPAPMITAVGPVPGPAGDAGGTAAAVAGAANPYSQDRTAAAEGRQLFVRFNCVGCHGGRAGGGMGPSLRDVDWLYGSTDAQIFSSIAEGRAHGMPSWGSTMNEDQLWKLVAYIKSMRTPDEPHPPS